MNVNFELYDGKTYKDLMKDIVTNTENKRDQIDIVISDLREKIQTINDAIMLAPIIQSYLDIGIKNDESLVKLAAVVQRLISSQTNAEDGGTLLTDEEKEQLLKTIKEVDLSSKEPVVKTKR
jgi:fructose-1,6-bisphosphatase